MVELSVGSEQNSSQQWQRLFDRHLEVLKEHLNIWSMVQASQSPDSNNHETARVFVDRTHSMIKSCQELATSFTFSNETTASTRTQETSQAATKPSSSAPASSTPSDAVPLPQSRKRRRVEESKEDRKKKSREPVAKDTDNLFVIDSNPTSVEELLSQDGRRKPSSRAKGSKQGPEVRLSGVLGGIPNSGEQSLPQTVHRDVTDRTRPLPTGDASEMLTVDLDKDDPFVKKVKARHQEKEEKRKKKLDKKRKRESNTSVDSLDAREAGKPEKKKKKHKREDKPEAQEVGGGAGGTGASSKRRGASASKERSKRRKKD